VRIDSKIEWADSAAELKQRFGPDVGPKSFTFIPGQVTDNQILLANNPEYYASLQALPEVERSRLLFGCWNTHPAAGKFFNRTWFEIVRAAPTLVTEVRYWDRAATEVPDGVESDASYTAGVRMGRSQRGQFFITDVSKFRRGPLGVETGVLNCASQDGYQVRIGLEEDPGQAGIAEADYYMRLLAGYDVARNPVRESKGARARPYSAQCEAGNVKLVDGDWIEDFLREHHNFVPEGRKCFKDQVDAASGAFCLLTRERRAGAMGKIIT
jgi:predicted phage terminase large subunit-like protein